MRIRGRNRWTAGLDIGSGFIKLVVIDHGKAEPEIVKIATGALAPGAISDGEIRDHGAVTETIRSLVRGTGSKCRHVNAAVGGRDVIIKRVQMDRMNEQDTRAVIRWEAERHVPFDMENVQLDFQIMDADADAPEMTVLLVAAKRELIEHRGRLLADAGLTPAMIDVDAFALSNALEWSYPELLGGLVALVNVGNETTNVNLIDDGVPILVRDIPFGTRRLRDALQSEHGMGAEQAEANLTGAGPAAQRRTAEDPLRGLVEDKVDELGIGLERAAAFLAAQPGSPRDASRVGWEPGSPRDASRVGWEPGSPRDASRVGSEPGSPRDTRRVGWEPGSPRDARRVGWESARESGGVGIGRVFVSGGGARVPGLADALGRRLGITTEVASPIQRLGVQPEALGSVRLDEVAPMLMLPIGLALRN